jgi:hypothetical protein
LPITIPAFSPYQGTLFPLRGLWRTPPEEGPRFVNAEIAWGTLGGTPPINTVQFALSGNSPVAFSQIVAMSVDNSRCGGSVDFLYPDSGFVLTVPAYNQGVYPVFTNALMFYAIAQGAVAPDVTIIQILNSMPPPVAIQPSSEQQNVSVSVGNGPANGTVAVVPAGVSGTLNGFTVLAAPVAPSGSTALAQLIDGTGKVLWSGTLVAPANLADNMTNLHVRFQNGINLVISGSTLTSGDISVNVYYAVP